MRFFGRTINLGLCIFRSIVFEDHRGSYIETFNQKDFVTECAIWGLPPIVFLQDDISNSHKYVLRGIHGDTETWKLISCYSGEFQLVIVDCNKDSKKFGKWDDMILKKGDGLSLLVPPNYGNSFLVLSEECIFHYKQSTYYNREGQFTYKWDEPKFGIDWGIKNPILSKRDSNAKYI